MSQEAQLTTDYQIYSVNIIDLLLFIVFIIIVTIKNLFHFYLPLT